MLRDVWRYVLVRMRCSRGRGEGFSGARGGRSRSYPVVHFKAWLALVRSVNLRVIWQFQNKEPIGWVHVTQSFRRALALENTYVQYKCILRIIYYGNSCKLSILQHTPGTMQTQHTPGTMQTQHTPGTLQTQHTPANPAYPSKPCKPSIPQQPCKPSIPQQPCKPSIPPATLQTQHTPANPAIPANPACHRKPCQPFISPQTQPNPANPCMQHTPANPAYHRKPCLPCISPQTLQNQQTLANPAYHHITLHTATNPANSANTTYYHNHQIKQHSLNLQSIQSLMVYTHKQFQNEQAATWKSPLWPCTQMAAQSFWTTLEWKGPSLDFCSMIQWALAMCCQ